MGIAGMRTRRAFTDDGIGLTGTVDRRNKRRGRSKNAKVIVSD